MLCNSICKNNVVKINGAKTNDAPTDEHFRPVRRIEKDHFQSQLSVVIRIVRSLLIVIHIVHRSRLTETSSVAFARVRRFEFRLLSRRDEMRVFFQILNDFFGHHFALKTAQRVLDRFVIINCDKSHSFSCYSFV